MGNKTVVRQKLCSMNFYAISYAVTKFENNEIITINSEYSPQHTHLTLT